nr:MAG TPA: hypothetical protein [Siphoviridae sp. ctEfY6]
MVLRQIKGKFFPFKTLFLLDDSFLDFYSWELNEIKKMPENGSE